LNTSKAATLIRQISIELMTDLINSSDLYVIQTEYSLYNFLRTWIYLRLFPNHNHNINDKNKSRIRPKSSIDSSNGTNNMSETDLITNYFGNRKDIKLPFLYTSEGRDYLKPFLALRTQYLINHTTDFQIIQSDNIIPREWITNHVLYHWQHVLKTDHWRDEGYFLNIHLLLLY